jgi:hypothetical protein
VYARHVECFSNIINLLAEHSQLARTLFTDGMRFVTRCARSRTAFAAENLVGIEMRHAPRRSATGFCQGHLVDRLAWHVTRPLSPFPDPPRVAHQGPS